MRKGFEDKLKDLNQYLVEMGMLVEKAIDLTHKGLIMQNVEFAEEAIKYDQDIDDLEKEIEDMCLKLLLLHHPVARDLRVISAALKMITDMERIGDQCADISEIIIIMAGQTYIKDLEDIPKMAAAASKMVTNAIDAYVKQDLKLARKVRRDDDEVDRLFLLVKKDLTDLIHADPNNIGQAVDLLMVAKYFERIGDHAENIAEWVEFSITGNYKKLKKTTT
ncbi:MAG: phosphate signaling complex protein PhoU [Defluviitaleaceae bacterium]|nr:phosphate signaling complex protein PhoU [Defluviitaleaceae bacterium]